VKTDLEKEKGCKLEGDRGSKKRIENYSGKISALKRMRP
jgi:hypothetical protein